VCACVRVCVCVLCCVSVCVGFWIIGIGLEVYNDQKEQEESLLDFF
jgi:hypothetical protein